MNRILKDNHIDIEKNIIEKKLGIDEKKFQKILACESLKQQINMHIELNEM